jgi:predicted nucleic acid-binding protein
LGADKEGFLSALGRAGSIALDTSACIYYLQAVGERYELISEVIRRAARGRVEVELSGIVEMELLVRPYRSGDMIGVRKIRSLVEGRGATLRDVSRDVLLASATIRAATGIRLPDAIIAGSAAVARCDAIVGNDTAFRRLNGISGVHVRTRRGTLPLPLYVHLDDYVTAS